MNKASRVESWKAPSHYEDRNAYEVARADSLECCADSDWHKQRCPKKSYWPCNKCGLFWHPDFKWCPCEHF